MYRTLNFVLFCFIFGLYSVLLWEGSILRNPGLTLLIITGFGEIVSSREPRTAYLHHWNKLIDNLTLWSLIKSESIFLPNVTCYPKGHSFLEGSQASLICYSGKTNPWMKMNMECWWNDNDRVKTEVLGENRVPVLLCLPKITNENTSFRRPLTTWPMTRPWRLIMNYVRENCVPPL